MKKRILFLLIACSAMLSHAFGQSGSDALENIGTFSSNFVKEMNVSAAEHVIPVNYYYRFTLTSAMDLTVSTCGSTVDGTGVFLMDENGETMDYDLNYDDCNSPDLGTLKATNLAPGTYMIMVDWNCDFGFVRTVIEGSLASITSCAEEMGTYNASFNYANSGNAGNPDIAYQGDTYKGGICYHFTLACNMDIVISNCGSSVLGSHIYVLNSSGNRIAKSTDNSSTNICSNSQLGYLEIPDMAAGSYYVVSVPYTEQGILRTHIMGVSSSLGIGSSDKNYVVTRTYSDVSGETWQDQVDYFDGMGRSEQSVHVGVSPAQGDLVSQTEYDSFGRPQKSWLPAEVTNNNGAYISSATLKNKAQISNGGDANPHTLTEYELSPLNRPMHQYGAGYDWQSKRKAVVTEYQTNIPTNSQLNCIHYQVTKAVTDTLITVKHGGNYPAGSLHATRTTDEDGNIILNFKDRFGQTVLSRMVQGGDLCDTYYLYDNFGNLLVVLPPKAAANMKTSEASWTNASSHLLRDYAYLYIYDSRNRMIAKRLAGQKWTRYVYDKADYPVFTQDSEQWKRGEWTFSLPDAFNRVCLQGICKNSFVEKFPSLTTMVKVVRNNTTGTYKGYSLSGVSLTSAQILTVNYYDDYAFMGKNGVPDSTNTNYKYEVLSEYGKRYMNSAQSRLTGMLTTKLDGATTPTYLPTIMYYDHRGQLIQSKGANHLTEGFEKEYTAYDFTGKPVKRKHIHSAAGKTTQTETYTYTYDHAGRLLTIKQSLNGGTQVTLADNEYDGLGRLKANKRNGNANLKSTYAYNIRSWMKNIAGTLFNQTLYYNDKRTNGTNTTYYNGNISAMDWKAATDNLQRGYDFTYDALSRLTKAEYLQGNARNNNFNTTYSYDSQGNILTLQRYGQTGASTYGLIDNLTFTLNGNQLKAANDASTAVAYNGGFEFKDGAKQTVEYGYDSNGNLTKDLNKNITGIQYNFLNLPSKVMFSDGSTLTYVYATNGTKLRTVHTISGVTTTTDYCGNVVYENGVQKLLLTEEGYVSLDGNKYHYYLKDHQGNNRVVVDQNGNVEETNHYYPFGGVFANTGNAQPYKYNGKELDAKKGLNWYDYGARHYDAALGRFITTDPLAEKYYSVTLYNYCANNPIRFIDPDGRGWNEAWPHLKNSVSGNISFGLKAEVSVQALGVKIGAQINTGSAQYGSDGYKVTTGASVNIGIVGIESYDNVYDLDNRTSVKENGFTISIPMWSEDYKEITTYDSTNRNYKEINKEETSKSEIGNINFSAALGVGVDVTIDLKEFWNFIVDLFE